MSSCMPGEQIFHYEVEYLFVFFASRFYHFVTNPGVLNLEAILETVLSVREVDSKKERSVMSEARTAPTLCQGRSVIILPPCLQVASSA